MIQITKVKKIFHDHHVQLSTQAINMIKEDIDRKLRKMAERCNEGNVKRLTPETYHIALGNYDKYIQGSITT